MTKVIVSICLLLLGACSTNRPQDKKFLESIGWNKKENINSSIPSNETSEIKTKEIKFLIVSKESYYFCTSEEMANENNYKIFSSKRYFVEGECENSDEIEKIHKKEKRFKDNKSKELLNKRVTKIKEFIRSNPNFKLYEETAIKRKISLGMPEELLVLSWGNPEKINKTVSTTGVFNQYVYENNYVYTENGIVTSYQSF